MNIGALLKTFLYLISSSLLYPTLFLLVALTVVLLIQAGAFLAEFLERMRLQPYDSERLPMLILHDQARKMLSHRSRAYLNRLNALLQAEAPHELAVETLFHEYTRNLWKTLDHLKILVRLGPALGLMGTLIPMGTGLAAMSQGDISKLSADLVVAFTTTVVGLAIGMAAFALSVIKKRWIETDIAHIEIATDLLVTPNHGGTT